MSSDDSGFDKEAEREKLREKYGDEDEDRENTRRMSELLLQGATMTGKHCDNCGDPIFRHDGQEFCPTCQHEAQAQAQNQSTASQGQHVESGQQATNAETDGETDQSPKAAQSSETETDQPADDEPRVEINDVRVADQHVDRSNVRRPPSQTDSDRRPTDDVDRRPHERTETGTEHGRDARQRTANDRAQGQNRTQARDSARAHEHRHARNAVANDANTRNQTASDAGDLGTAREALVRKLTDLARRAEATEDVTRSRELLSATREAAEALAALDRANR